MPTIRIHLPGTDKSRCEECADRAEVVIEEYPNPQHHRSFCRDCATVALQQHPDLLGYCAHTQRRTPRVGRFHGFSLDAAEDVGCRPETNYGWSKGTLGEVEEAAKKQH